MSSLGRKLALLRGRFRRRFFLHGVASIAGTLAILSGVSFVLDYWLHLPPEIRGVELAVLAVVLFVTAHRQLLSPLSAPISDEDMALTYEKAYPASANLLISAVQLSRQMANRAYPYSRALTETLISHADRYAESLDPDRFASSPTLLRRALLSVLGVLVCAVSAAAFPEHATIWLRRLFLGSVDWPRDTTLMVEFPARILRGEDASVRITARGAIPGRVRLRYRTDAAIEGTARIEKTPGSNSFGYTFKRLLEGVKFRVAGGDDDRPIDHRIEVLVPPRLEDVKISHRPPAYTGLPETAPVSSGTVEVLAGSSLRFRGAASQALAKAWLSFEPLAGGSREDRESRAPADKPPPLQLDVRDKEISGIFPVMETKVFSVHLLSTSVLENSEVPVYRVQAVPDHPPNVTLVKPGRDMRVLASSTIRLTAMVEDDYGVKRAAVRFQIARAGAEPGPESALEAPLARPSGPKEKMTVSASFPLAGLSLKEGDEVTYSFEAADGNDVTGPGIGRSASYKLLVVSRSALEDDVDKLGAEVREDLDNLIELETRILHDTQDVSGRIASKPAPEETDQRRLSHTALYQEQVGPLAESVAEKIARMIEDILLFGLSQKEILGSLEEVKSLLSSVGPKSTSAAGALTGARTADAPARLQSALRKEAEILADLGDARETMNRFAQLSSVIRTFRGLIDKEAEIKREVQEEARKGKK